VRWGAIRSVYSLYRTADRSEAARGRPSRSPPRGRRVGTRLSSSIAGPWQRGPATVRTDVSFQTLLYQCSDGVASITLNRPEHLNTIVPPMPEEIEAAWRRRAPMSGCG